LRNVSFHNAESTSIFIASCRKWADSLDAKRDPARRTDLSVIQP
jgi:hypothetical protein